MDIEAQKQVIINSPPICFGVDDMNPNCCYLINKSWWNKWCAYTGFNTNAPNAEYPGLIDNSHISLSAPDSAELIHLPKRSWKVLKSAYGYSAKHKIFIINSVPQYSTITTFVKSNQSEKKTFKVPLALPLSIYTRLVCRKLRMKQEQSKFFIQFPDSYQCKLKNYSKTLQECGFYDSVNILVKSGKKRSAYTGLNDLDHLDIREEDEYEEDDGMLFKNNFTVDNIVDIDRIESKNDFGRDVVDMDRIEFYELERVEEVRRMVKEGFRPGVKLEVKRLRRILKEVEKLVERLNGE